jgi:hypothetical protein
LMLGELDIILPGVPLLKYVSAGSALLGFGLVIVATLFVIVEGSITHRQLDSELLDVPDLAQSTGQAPGSNIDRQPSKSSLPSSPL